MPQGKTAVLAINSAMLPHNITIDVSSVLAPAGGAAKTVTAIDVWTGEVQHDVSKVTREVRPHSNIFLILQ